MVTRLLFKFDELTFRYYTIALDNGELREQKVTRSSIAYLSYQTARDTIKV
jgi:hypothetical protein